MFRVHASDRAVALSEQLIRAHQTLRERLATVREEVAAVPPARRFRAIS